MEPEELEVEDLELEDLESADLMQDEEYAGLMHDAEYADLMWDGDLLDLCVRFRSVTEDEKRVLLHRTDIAVLNKDTSIQNTPLAPSVEKAYYRKCIELKRRLNEVEAANDEAKTRRVRVDRAIMKMRLERAFLLGEMRNRMDGDMVDSEGSGDDGITPVSQG